MEGENQTIATFVDSINISSTNKTTELPKDFVSMLGEQEIQVMKYVIIGHTKMRLNEKC